jgi:hypothetical protein
MINIYELHFSLYIRLYISQAVAISGFSHGGSLVRLTTYSLTPQISTFNFCPKSNILKFDQFYGQK